MSCKVKVYSPKTGEYIESKLWQAINNEYLNGELADKLFAQTRTEQFKAWFGDVYNPGESHSQVVTEDGEPLMVYHSSLNDFDTFNPEKSKELGFHFGTEKAALDRYAADAFMEGIEANDNSYTLRDKRRDIQAELDEFNIKPYFLNIRNMVEGADYLEAEELLQDKEDMQNEYKYLYDLAPSFMSDEARKLIIAFYGKGKITFDQAEDILISGSTAGLREALGNPDGYWYTNKLEDKGQKSYVVFDPNNIKAVNNTGEFSSNDDNTMYSLSDNEVNFTLKIVDALRKTPRKKYPSNSIQGFYNDLTKLGTTKDQINLLKDYILANNIQEIDTEQLAIDFAATASFTIEIKTSYTYDKTENNNTFKTEFESLGVHFNRFEDNDNVYFSENNELFYKVNKNSNKTEYLTKEQFNLIKQKNYSSSQYYANMTVPGGTNYTENEISTPAIIPSIKGHAQFSTDNGIGWFRSDEQAITNELEKKLQKDLASVGPDYEEEKRLKRILEEIGSGQSSKTRRILEIQSDLFQKGRDKDDLINKSDKNKLIEFLKTEEKYLQQLNNELEEIKRLGENDLVEGKLDDIKQQENIVRINKQNIDNFERFKKLPDNQFLQLLNKDNNWVTFFIKSIIQDSAKKGYEKVLFPTGNTASKVEGHTTLEEFKKQKEDRIKEIEEQKANYKLKDYKGAWEVQYGSVAFGVQANTEQEAKLEANKRFDREINQLKQELERVEKEGFGALKPIYNFYENTVTNILKKQGYNPVLITDEYGNTWNEINITPKVRDLILLNLKEQGYYKSIPENILGVLQRKGILSRYNKDTIEDRWYFIRGKQEGEKQDNINYHMQEYLYFMSMNNLNTDMFKLKHTEGDNTPYLVLNPEFNFEDAIIQNDKKIHREKYEAIIDFLSKKFGINSNQIVYTTKEQFKKDFPEAYQENMQSVYSDGKFYFFTRNLTADITVEELLHPFIYTVKELNPQLFDNLLKEALKHYPKLNAKIQALYANKSKNVRDQELVTQALSRVFNNVYENEEPQSLLDVIKDFVSWIKEILNNALKYFQTGKYINIPIENLPPQLSLYEIAKIINATDTKFDVIFPKSSMYSLEAETANFSKTIENILADERVSSKVNEKLVKLPKTLSAIKNKLNNTINENERKNLQGIINSIHQLENEDNENLVAFQLKGIITSIQLSNELIKNLNAMSNSDNDDNIKLSYYMSVYKTAKAMDSFKDLMIELKDELSSNLVTTSNTKDLNAFINMLGRAISSEDEISHKIQNLVKTPLLNILVESNEYVYRPKLNELTANVEEIEKKIQNTSSQPEKDKLSRELNKAKEYLKTFLEKAPTRENLEKILNGMFKDANSLSLIFEAKIANGNPLVATLQNIINDIYDSANRDMLDSKNEAQDMMDKYTQATGIGLRDMNKRYEQVRDIVSIPSEIIVNDKGEPELDDEGNIKFKFYNQDTLLSNIENSYITEYMKLEMIKNFYLDKHRENVYKDQADDAVYAKYKEALQKFQEFVDKNSQKEYKQEIYDFKAILNERIGDKTLREITGGLYDELEDQYQSLENATDTDSRIAIIERIKDINIELKRLRTIYDENGNKKEGDDLLIAQRLSEYTKLRSKYYESYLSEDAQRRYEFDKSELEKRKQQYLDDNNEATYKKNLARIQQEVISQDYFNALVSITSELNELNNVLSMAVAEALPQYANKNIFKQQKKDVYDEIRELAKPYRDEEGIIDGNAMIKRHPEVALKIKELQQYIEDVRFETSNFGNLSTSESNELNSLYKKEGKTQDELDRFAELVAKKKQFTAFKKENEELFKQLANLYKQLDELTDRYTTDYYDEAVSNQLALAKLDDKLIASAKDFVSKNNHILIEGVNYKKGIEGKDPGVWYREQKLGKKITYIPLDTESTTGYNEIVDIVLSYLAKLTLEDSQWWKDNHFQEYRFDEKAKDYIKVDRPIYIWEHQSPKNPNFVETKPAKQYYRFVVKDEYINKNFETTYRGIPIPKEGMFVNKRYNELKKNKAVFEFLNYFTNKYLNIQKIYDAKGDSVKMGHVLPSIIKTSGENAVNMTNKVLSFDGTFSEMFMTNTMATDNDTSYLVGGSQTNNKAIPIRFVGKMDTEMQTKNIVAAILLFEYSAGIYKSLNETLPIFEASQLIASKSKVTETLNYADRLSFTKKIKNIFQPKENKKQIERVKDVEKSVLSKTVDDILDIFVYGQRMKPQLINAGMLGTIDLAKVSSGILGFAAKSLFIGNAISAINNSLSTRLQIIINSSVKSDLYTLKNLKNAQAKAPKYTKNLLSDWTKLGNKSLIGQVLDYFAFTNENPMREITSKSEFTMLKNKMEFLTSAKQMSEYEVLFIQFLTMADATPIMINGKQTKLSNIEEIFELKNGKLKMKDGVEFTKEQQKTFRARYQSLARKVAGAYRTTEISSIETNWAGKGGMFLRRYFVSMLTNRFQGTRFNFQEGDIYTGYQKEVAKNLIQLFTLYKGNFMKYYGELSEKEKAAHIKVLYEYGMLILLLAAFSLMGGNDDKKKLKDNSWAYNMTLVAILRAQSELQQFTLAGIDDIIRVGKNPFMVFQTLGNVYKSLRLVIPTIIGDESAFYKQNTGLHKKGDSKLIANTLKLFGYTGVTWHPEEYILNFKNAQNR